MADKVWTPAEMREQINKMWLRNYPDGPTDQNWILNVGIGAGMLDVAADRIEALEAALRKYGQHDPTRCFITADAAGEPTLVCKCGLEAALDREGEPRGV